MTAAIAAGTASVTAAATTTAVITSVTVPVGTAAAMATGMTFTGYSMIYPFTEHGYLMQKFISPVAARPLFSFGNGQNYIGFEFSMGIGNWRTHAGGAYYFNDYDNMYTGWEARYGFEVGIPNISLERTWYNRRGKEFDQIRNKISIGNPFFPVFIQNDNDFPDSDMYYTQGTRIILGGIFDIGLDLVTGRPIPPAGPGGPNGTYDNERNHHRAGILSFRIGPFRFGYNNEKIRDKTQNKWHDMIDTPRFPIDYSRRGRWYWTFGGW